MQHLLCARWHLRFERAMVDRFHANLLTSPRQTSSALAYVVLNARKHFAAVAIAPPDASDACSSAAYFDGSSRACELPAFDDAPVTPPRGWLLRVGWRRHGLIDPGQIPGRRRTYPSLVDEEGGSA